jgi:NAD(P)H-dependent FMN reductase
VRLGSESRWAQRFQGGEIAQAANLDANDPEWNRKAAAFVSYGSAMGARAVQQLRETAIEIQMAPIRSSGHIPVATLWAHFQGGDVDEGLAELDKSANVMIDDLIWWTGALKAARER